MSKIEELENIFKKHSISGTAKKDIVTIVNKIINTNEKVTEIKKKVDSGSIKNNGATDTICRGITGKGNRCDHKAKDNGFCGVHNPDKPSKSSKPKTKKTNIEKNKCNAVCITKKTNESKNCSCIGSVKPEGAEHYYCKRHAEKWNQFENNDDENEEINDDDEPMVDDDEEDSQGDKELEDMAD
jgi:hypothetical protein